MNSLNAWVVNILAAIVLSEIVLMIIPSGNIKKFVKFTIGIMLMTMLIDPLIRLINLNY